MPRSPRRLNSTRAIAGNTASTSTGSGRRWKPSAISRLRSISARRSSRPWGCPTPAFLISSAQRARVAPMFSRGQDGPLAPTAFEMPQRPEFFMGGGALFSTPRNYMQFLQMLLHEGTLGGVQLLKPETVALRRQNHIGDLNVVTLKTAHPETSNDANLFP